MNEEITIDLKDLAYRVLLRWRLILIVCIVGAILADAVGVFKDMKALREVQNADVQAEQDAAEAEIEGYRAELSDRELEECEAAIENYTYLRNRFNNLASYQKNSVYYNLDFQRAPTVTMLYRIVGAPGADGEEVSAGPAGMFITSLVDEETVASISQSLGIDAEYVRELIYSDFIYISNNESLHDAVTVTVFGRNRSMCDTIADAIARRAEELNGRISSAYPGCSATLVNRNYAEGPVDSIRTRQQQVVKDAHDMRYSWGTIQGSLSEGQKKYYNAVLDMKDREEIEEMEETAAPVALPTVSYFHKKYVLIGFLLFGFIACILIAMSYILTPVVRVKENIIEGYGRPVLATFWPEREKSGFLSCVDDWLTKLFYGRESSYPMKKRIDMLCASLGLLLKKRDIESLYITGASDKNKELAGELIKGIKGRVKADFGENILYDAKSLEKMSASGAVVFVETAGDSRYEEITGELEMAGQSGVEVLGFVILQQW